MTEPMEITKAVPSHELAATAVAAAAKAEVEAAYVMALKSPRNEADARVKILKMCGVPAFAAKARYAKPIGNTKIEGPSIRFAEEMLRHWGNVLAQQTAIYEDEEKRIVKVTVRDLESNLTYSKELTIEKHVERKDRTGRDVIRERPNTTGQRIFIVRATEDELQNKEAALVSKVVRNNGLRLIPQNIIDEAMAQVRETLEQKATEDPEGERKVMVDSFASLGIMPSDIEEFVGAPVAQFTPAQITDMKAVYISIKDGQATWTDYVTKEKGPEPPPTGDLKERLKQQVQAQPAPLEKGSEREQDQEPPLLGALVDTSADELRKIRGGGAKLLELWRSHGLPSQDFLKRRASEMIQDETKLALFGNAVQKALMELKGSGSGSGKPKGGK